MTAAALLLRRRAGDDAGCPALGVLTTFPALDADTVKDLTAVAVDLTPAGLVVTYPSSEDPA